MKSEAFFHLTGNVSYLLVLLLSLLMVPAVVIREQIGWQKVAALDFPLFFGATFSFLAFYVSSQREIGRGLLPTLRCLPALLSLGIGLSVHNAHAVLEGLLRRPAAFTRTPKYRIEGRGGEWRSKTYHADRSLSVVGELLLAAYFGAALVFAVRFSYWTAVPFLLVFFNGFAYTAAMSLHVPGSLRRSRGRLSAAEAS